MYSIILLLYQYFLSQDLSRRQMMYLSWMKKGRWKGKVVNVDSIDQNFKPAIYFIHTNLAEGFTKDCGSKY